MPNIKTSGKVAIVTGGQRLGSEICIALGEMGKSAVASQNEERELKL
jgi:NAD(P)-dependent dehydrogenase (short-subunit alcohol dehydrogenase family)